MMTPPDLRAASSPPAPWLEVAAGSAPETTDAPLASHRVYLQVLVVTALVLLLVGALGALASRQVAEQEAVRDAARQAAVLADAVVVPALQDGIVTGEPAAVA